MARVGRQFASSEIAIKGCVNLFVLPFTSRQNCRTPTYYGYYVAGYEEPVVNACIPSPGVTIVYRPPKGPIQSGRFTQVAVIQK